MSELSVWVSDRPGFSPSVFDCWITGLNVELAARNREEYTEYPGIADIVVDDTRDQYMLFKQLEPFLQNPVAFKHQDIVPMSEDDRNHLLYSYYHYDADLMLKILGKQLSRGLRKDLDELADETKISLTSCNRQFDNLRRIFKTVEDQPGSLEQLIKDNFLLNGSQAKDYAAMVFITDNRLAVEKKALQGVPLPVFLDCAREFMRSWTSVGEPGGNDQDLQKKFLQELRELKYNIMGSRETLDAIFLSIKRQSPGMSKQRLQHVFTVIKAILQIGGGLSYTKEWRDIFEDLMQDVVVPLRADNWTIPEVNHLMKVVQRSFPALPLSAELKTRSEATFETFISTIARVIGFMM
eukprot:m.127680 g.127680  ORF g.127680 m.127680 type:complete len:352 (-) comp15660_c2_seq1:33-1088(-)